MINIDLSALCDELLYAPSAPLMFNTGLFLVLFAAFIVVYELIKKWPIPRMILTILFSLYFYYKSSAECCFILLGICLSDYTLGNALGALTNRLARRSIVFINIALNLGALVYFKYFNLLLSTWADITHTGFDALNIILPAGISFITFRSISYIVDIYRHQLEPERNFLRYTFALTFFPPLLAGPVVRAKDLLPQVKANPIATSAMIGEGLFLIMTGLLKKVVIADFISGNFVNRIFENPDLYTGFENLVGWIGFTVQIYCDFSGYSDMAIGLALIMGYRFKDNFNAPFKSRNPSEFWHRWHISLSTWLRDYLYIPLGGSHCGAVRTYFNNFITMLLGGLWHGASWMYLLWGAYQGLLLVIHKALKRLIHTPDVIKRAAATKVVNIAITFSLTVIGFAIFRSDNIDTFCTMCSRIIYDFNGSIISQFVEGYPLIVTAIGAALVIHFLPDSLNDRLKSSYVAIPPIAQGLILALVIFIAIQVRSSDLAPFIYMQY